jgi:mRNA interferase MazF
VSRVVKSSGKYVPHRGDLVWVPFGETKGSEQAGKRPAIVVSPEQYNDVTGLCLICPITSKQKGYPFEVLVAGKKIKGVVLCDQIKNIDYEARNVSFIESSTFAVMRQIKCKLGLLLP